MIRGSDLSVAGGAGDVGGSPPESVKPAVFFLSRPSAQPAKKGGVPTCWERRLGIRPASFAATQLQERQDGTATGT
jgi:hypothetical protein